MPIPISFWVGLGLWTGGKYLYEVVRPSLKKKTPHLVDAIDMAWMLADAYFTFESGKNLLTIAKNARKILSTLKSKKTKDKIKALGNVLAGTGLAGVGVWGSVESLEAGLERKVMEIQEEAFKKMREVMEKNQATEEFLNLNLAMDELDEFFEFLVSEWEREEIDELSEQIRREQENAMRMEMLGKILGHIEEERKRL